MVQQRVWHIKGGTALNLISGLVSETIGKVSGLISEFITDKDKALELQTQIEKELIKLEERALEYETKLMESRRDIIVAEAKSESWLTRNWRPITMLTFTALIVADWLGISAPNLTPELKGKLFSIIQIGLGGYVIGRSAEKIAREIKPILEKKNK